MRSLDLRKQKPFSIKTGYKVKSWVVKIQREVLVENWSRLNLCDILKHFRVLEEKQLSRAMPWKANLNLFQLIKLINLFQLIKGQEAWKKMDGPRLAGLCPKFGHLAKLHFDSFVVYKYKEWENSWYLVEILTFWLWHISFLRYILKWL